jgi:hypothetical protein
MGLFGASRPGGFNWGRAIAGALGGSEVVNAFARQDVNRREREENEATARAYQAQVAGARSLGMTDQQIAAAGDRLGEVVQTMLQSRQFDSGGGSIFNPLAPPERQWTTAPSERTMGPDIIRTNSQGQANPVYQGIDPVAITEGGSLYGVRGNGQTIPLIAQPGASQPQQPPPTGAPQPGEIINGRRFKGGNPNDPNAWEPVGQGGAGQAGPRTFPY